MKCPVCEDVRMREVEKNGVHIDVCPDCKGVWLDRGELDKLMAGVREVRDEYDEWVRETPPAPPPQYDPRQQPYPPQGPQYDAGQQPYPPYPQGKYDPRYPHYKKKRKKNVFDLFEDLF